MSSKRAIRRRACKGKVRHASIGAAWAAVKAMRRTKVPNEAERFSAYGCGFCGGFHIGHTPRRSLR